MLFRNYGLENASNSEKADLMHTLQRPTCSAIDGSTRARFGSTWLLVIIAICTERVANCSERVAEISWSAGSAQVALVLNQHVTNRTPLLIRGLVPDQVTSEVANWVNKQHNGTVKIRVVPSSQFDGRHTNLQPVYGGNPNDTSRMVYANTTSLLQYILGHSEAPCACPGDEPCDWRELRVYWRVVASELAENSPDEGSRQLLRQVDAAQFSNPFDNGLIEGKWQRTAVLTRAGGAGLYYPAHIDCAPNMLQVSHCHSCFPTSQL